METAGWPSRVTGIDHVETMNKSKVSLVGEKLSSNRSMILACVCATALLLTGAVSLRAQDTGTSLDFATSRPVPHGVHIPQHGGIFFMALDNQHHLEGVLLKSGVFKVYLYDVFTKPLPTAEVKGASASVQVGESESAPRIPLVVGKDGHTLEAPMGNSLRLPVTITLFLRFRDSSPKERPEVFTFPFSHPIEENFRPGQPATTEISFLMFYIYLCIFLGGSAGIWIVRDLMVRQIDRHLPVEGKIRAGTRPKDRWKWAEAFQLWRVHRQFFPISLLRFSYMALWVLTLSWLFFGLSLLRRMNLQ